MEAVVFLLMLIAGMLYNSHCREKQRRVTENNLYRARKILEENPTDADFKLDVRFYEQVYEEINGWHDLTQIQNRVAKRLYPTLEKKIDKLKAG